MTSADRDKCKSAVTCCGMARGSGSLNIEPYMWPQPARLITLSPLTGSGSGFTFSAEPVTGYGQRHCQPLLQRPHHERSLRAATNPAFTRPRFLSFGCYPTQNSPQYQFPNTKCIGNQGQRSAIWPENETAPARRLHMVHVGSRRSTAVLHAGRI